jgi:Cu/Ag efflux protein CusF
MGNMDMSGGAKQSADAKDSMSHGEIKKVDAANGKLTIKHGPLENLGMEAMTMVFKVKDPAMLSQVKVGDKIDFVAEK